MTREEAWDAVQRGDRVGSKTGLSYEDSYYYKDTAGITRVHVGMTGKPSSIELTQLNTKGEPYHIVRTAANTLKKFKIKDYK